MMLYYLYVKTHNETGLKYLGKTKNPNPYKYPGSGKRWTYHLKKHGYNVDTVILKECASNEEVREWGLYYSKLWNVVEDTNWANIKPENGDGGIHSEETKHKISIANTGQTRSAASKEKMSIASRGKEKTDLHRKKLSEARLANPSPGNTGKVHTEETKEKMRQVALNMSAETKQKMSLAKKGKPLSEEHCEKVRLALTGKPKSEEHKRKLREAKRRKKI